MKETISVIVPIFNRELYLKNCIDSILNQSYRNLEIILVDDGSTDRSLSICKEYALLDERIKIVHKENGGLSSARNAGINVATGEWISFIDSDDSINMNFYTTLKEVADKNKCDIVQCDMERVAEQKKVNDIKEYSTSLFTNKQALEEFYGRRYTVFKSSCNKIFRKNLFNDVRYPEGRIFEDRWIANQLYYKAHCVAYIDYPMYYYTVNNSGIMHQKASKKNYDTCILYLKHYDYFTKKNEKELAALSIKQFFISLLNLRYTFKRFSDIYDSEKDSLQDLYQSNKDKLWGAKGLTIFQKVCVAFAWNNIWIYYCIRDCIDLLVSIKK